MVLKLVLVENFETEEVIELKVDFEFEDNKDDKDKISEQEIDSVRTSNGKRKISMNNGTSKQARLDEDEIILKYASIVDKNGTWTNNARVTIRPINSMSITNSKASSTETTHCSTSNINKKDTQNDESIAQYLDRVFPKSNIKKEKSEDNESDLEILEESSNPTMKPTQNIQNERTITKENSEDDESDVEIIEEFLSHGSKRSHSIKKELEDNDSESSSSFNKDSEIEILESGNILKTKKNTLHVVGFDEESQIHIVDNDDTVIRQAPETENSDESSITWHYHVVDNESYRCRNSNCQHATKADNSNKNNHITWHYHLVDNESYRCRSKNCQKSEISDAPVKSQSHYHIIDSAWYQCQNRDCKKFSNAPKTFNGKVLKTHWHFHVFNEESYRCKEHYCKEASTIQK